MAVLSICMMVKDEEKNLPRCLESLKNLREEIETELIIVDTGSTDETVQIAKKYTDSVFFHSWMNDFGSMRNVTISYALGEWILIIDADEVLNEDQGIIEFINNRQESLKYNAAIIRSRDYTKLSDERSYFEYNSPRLFKNDGKFRYDGKVHNQAIYSEPGIVLKNACLFHYGYNREDRELINKKIDRTASLLKKELEKNPDDIYYRYQLASTYSMGNKTALALNEIEKAVSLVRLEKNIKVYTYVIKLYLMLLKESGKTHEIISICEHLDEVVRADMDLCYFYSETLYRYRQFEKAKLYFELYLEIGDAYDKAGRVSDDLSSPVQTAQLREDVLGYLAEIAFSVKNFDAVHNYLKEVERSINLENLIPIVVASYIHQKDVQGIIEYAKRIERKCADAVIYTFLFEVERQLADASKIFKKEIRNGVAFINRRYCEFVNLLDRAEKNESVTLEEINDFVSDGFDVSELYLSQLYYYQMRNQKSIYEIFVRYDKYEIQQIIEFLNVRYSDLPQMLECRVCDDETSLIKLRINQEIVKFLLNDMGIDEVKRGKLLNRYFSQGIRYIKLLYNAEFYMEMDEYITDTEERWFALLARISDTSDMVEKKILMDKANLIDPDKCNQLKEYMINRVQN